VKVGITTLEHRQYINIHFTFNKMKISDLPSLKLE
jgi:hypothetical protein